MIPWNLVYLPFFALFTFGPLYFVVPHFILNYQEITLDHVKCNIPKSQPRFETLTSYPPLLYSSSLNSTLRTPSHVHTLEIIRAPHIDHVGGLRLPKVLKNMI
jgi:hypothetical protein